MKQITFQLVRGYSLISRTIGYWGAGYYGHIDTLTPAGTLRGARSDVIQGIPAGVHDRPANYERWAKCVRYTVEVTDNQFAQFWAFSSMQLGKQYDTHGLVETFVLGRDWRDDNQWWCSELVAACLEASGVIVLAPELQKVTPGDCAFIFAGLLAKREEIPVKSV